VASELSLVLKLKDEASKELEKSKGVLEKYSGQIKAAGIAMTAMGAGGLKLAADSRKINAELAQTAITLGVTTKEMRNLTLATTNVTFPISSVTATFDLLTRAGVRNTDEMKASAMAFDTLGDATGASAEAVADILIPAMKNFGEQLPKNSADLDKFTWLAKNTTIELSEFGSVMSYVSAYGQDLDLTSTDLIATLAALEAKGISGSAATKLFRTAITQATSEGKSLNEVLGLSQEEIDVFTTKMGDATGITDQYAEAANTQFGLMDKIKQKFSELTLVAGSYLEPLEPILGAMSALGPMMIFASSAMGKAAVTTTAHTASLIAHKVASLAVAAATKIVVAAQWLWNIALSANPIGIIILAIGALIAIGVLLWKNWDKVAAFFKSMWEGIKEAFKAGVNFVMGLAEGFANVWVKAINFVIGLLNKINFTIPDWVPLIGGKSFGINIAEVKEVTLPRMAKGGIVTSPTLAMIGEAGPEAVVPLGGKGGMGNIYVTVNVQGSVTSERDLVAAVREGLIQTGRANVSALGAYA